MKHPNTEDWMSFLYDENSPRERSELKAHLRGCPECSAKVAAWRAGMRELDHWTLRETRPPVPLQSALKWAAAVMVLLVGFGFGRISSPGSAEIKSLRRTLSEELSRQLAATRAEMSDELKQQQSAAADSADSATQDWLDEFAKSAEEKSAADYATIADALKQLDAKWTRNQAALRRELETVAVLTEDGLADTQQRLVQLANFTQSSGLK